ncbi:MAG: phytoene/squalene synthase family protein [Aeromicrobium sp.]|nr:phytoene/squalene synthase family protein [Burkholderiales bacterium]
MARENMAVSPANAYTIANELLAKRGHTFHWARRLLSASHAERATRLYGFCRRMDDIADEAVSLVVARAELAAARIALQTGHSEDPAMRDMLQLMALCDIDRMIPLELIQGVESDLSEVRIGDTAELLTYCYRVAGTVGLMMTSSLDVTAPEALPYAIDLGIAMQLTNICRDVREDALRGRRYLPESLVGAIEPKALIEPTSTVRLKAVHALRSLLDLADRHYASGEQGLRYLPVGARAGILVAARLYRQIGVVIRERDFDCWSSRATVGGLGKVAVTLQALDGSVGRRPDAAMGMTHGFSHYMPPVEPGTTWSTGCSHGD